MMKPEASLATALGVSGLVIALHRGAVPPIADLRSTVPGSPPHYDVDKSRRQATWASIALVSLISLLTHDVRVLITGGTVAVAYDWWERSANEVHPSSGLIPTTADQPTVIAKNGRIGAQVVEMNPYANVQTSVM